MFEYYLFFKFAHIISFVSWMAAMFYLPRLFVYHCEEKYGNKLHTKFCIMERRLIKVIMTPAMISTWVFGALLVLNNNALIHQFWMLIKIFLVILMSGLHGFFIKCSKKFLVNENTMSPRFYRYINEAPTLVFIFIIYLVVFKPSF